MNQTSSKHERAETVQTGAGHVSDGTPGEFAGKRVYFVGIAGSGMSGLARMLKARGAVVSGSDRCGGVGGEGREAAESLIAEGIDVGSDQSRGWLPEACDLVVASAAVKADHPQMVEARRRGVETLLYAEALGRCMAGRTGVCVAGTHGKSTTTAMLGVALADAGLDPTVIVGANCAQLAGGEPGAGTSGFRLGAGRIPAGALAGSPGILVAESCEFNRSFHNYRPRVACITNVEADHLDCYGTLGAVVESFRAFARLLPGAAEGGKLIIGHEGAHREEIAAGLACAVETVGTSPDADWRVGYDAPTRGVRVSRAGRVIAEWTNLVAGRHNAVNAATALALAVSLGADAGVVAKSLSRFRGVDRRMQLLGEKDVGGGAVRVFDDYGHHPTEIDVTLRALREAERPDARGGRLICIFQPHQHSRTRHLLEEFAGSFGAADAVIIPDIYAVRDSREDQGRVSARDLVERARARGVAAEHVPEFEGVVRRLGEVCRAGDVVVVMGAGPVWRVGKAYLGG